MGASGKRLMDYGLPQARLSQCATAVASTGLWRRVSAPFARNFARRAAIGNAVTKMVGGAQPSSRSRSCISTPDMPGIRTSEMRQAASAMCPDWRKASAGAKTYVSRPNEPRSALLAVWAYGPRLVIGAFWGEGNRDLILLGQIVH